MSDGSGKMPEEYVNEPAPPNEQLKVRDLRPEHGEVFIGVGDVAVDAGRSCWVLLDAPVFGEDFRDVAPLVLRRARDGGYEIRMGGPPEESSFTPGPTPDAEAWARAEVL